MRVSGRTAGATNASGHFYDFKQGLLCTLDLC